MTGCGYCEYHEFFHYRIILQEIGLLTNDIDAGILEKPAIPAQRWGEMAFLILANEQVQEHMEKALASVASRVVDT